MTATALSPGEPLAGVLDSARRVWQIRWVNALVKVLVTFLVAPIAINYLGPWKFIPAGVLVEGAVVGALFGLLGVGLVMVYKVSRIISFAQASLGSVPAVIALNLMSNRGVPYPVVAVLVLVGAPLLGAIVETILKRFSSAPRLILTVATIGIGLILAFIEFRSPSWVGGTDTGAASFPTPFSDIKFSIGTQVLTGDHVVAVVVTAILVGLVGAFFKFTDVGLAARASAENAERASLLGIPVARVSLIVWSLAALLSGAALFLKGPINGVAPGGTAGPSVLIYGLACAVIARMESTPVAFASGMALGMMVQGTTFVTGRSSTADGALLVVVLVALLFQKAGLGRASDSGQATWQAAKEFKGIPTELRGVREVVLAKNALWGLVALVALAGPFVFPDDAGRMAIICCDAIVVVSAVILTGWGGQISLGQFGFAGIGALVTAKLAADRGWDFTTVLLVAGLAGALAAVLIGLPALRIKGLFLAVTTLAFAFTVQFIFLNPAYFGDGSDLVKDQLVGVPKPILYGRFDVSQERRFYFVCLFFLAASLAIAASLRKHRSGRILMATRDNGRVAQAFGVNLARTKLVTFAISGFLAAIGGSLLSYELGLVDGNAYTPLISISVLAAVVIGGTTSLPGSVLGTLWVFGIPLLLDRRFPGIGFLAGGVGVLVLLLAAPGGLAELLYRGRDAYLRKIAAKHGIVVPSLVADVRQERAEAAKADAEVIEAAAEHVEELEELEHRAHEEALWCPVCFSDVPVAEAATHPHFARPQAVDEVEATAFAPVDEAPAGTTKTRRRVPLKAGEAVAANGNGSSAPRTPRRAR